MLRTRSRLFAGGSSLLVGIDRRRERKKKNKQRGHISREYSLLSRLTRRVSGCGEVGGLSGCHKTPHSVV